MNVPAAHTCLWWYRFVLIRRTQVLSFQSCAGCLSTCPPHRVLETWSLGRLPSGCVWDRAGRARTVVLLRVEAFRLLWLQSTVRNQCILWSSTHTGTYTSIDLNESFCEIAPILVPAVHSDTFCFSCVKKKCWWQLGSLQTLLGLGTLACEPTCHSALMSWISGSLGLGLGVILCPDWFGQRQPEGRGFFSWWRGEFLTEVDISCLWRFPRRWMGTQGKTCMNSSCGFLLMQTRWLLPSLTSHAAGFEGGLVRLCVNFQRWLRVC